MSLKKRNSNGLVFLLFLFLVSACSYNPESSIPGKKDTPISFEKLKVSHVLAALRCQVGIGYANVFKRQQELRKEYKKHTPEKDRPEVQNRNIRLANSFNLLKGTATFRGKTTIAGTDEGRVSILVPTGISTITPSAGGKRISTSVETVTRKFGLENTAIKYQGQVPAKKFNGSFFKLMKKKNRERTGLEIFTYEFIDLNIKGTLYNTTTGEKTKIESIAREEDDPNSFPKLPAVTVIRLKANKGFIMSDGDSYVIANWDPLDCITEEVDKSKIAVGTFFSERMLVAFQDTIDSARTSRGLSSSPYNASLTNTNLEIEANFSVQRIFDAGIKANVLFSSSNSSAPTLEPNIAFVNDEKGEYTVSISIPMLAANVGDSRRFYQCVNRGEISFCLESPFIEKQQGAVFPPTVVLEDPEANFLAPEGSKGSEIYQLNIQKGPQAF